MLRHPTIIGNPSSMSKVAIAARRGGCNMFTDSGNAPGRPQIAFESARATV